MSWDDDDEYLTLPNIGGTGSLHDLDPAPAPRARLAGLKSVSPAAREAMAAPRPSPKSRPIGFHTGPKRPTGQRN